MLIHVIGSILLIIMLTVAQAIACNLPRSKSISLRLLILLVCVLCSSTYIFAMYSQAVLNEQTEAIWSILDEDEYQDNKFIATAYSVKFLAKDRLELDITFEPGDNFSYYDTAPSVRQVHLKLASPSKSQALSTVPMYFVGIPLWIITFAIGWVFRRKTNTKYTAIHRQSLAD